MDDFEEEGYEYYDEEDYDEESPSPKKVPELEETLEEAKKKPPKKVVMNYAQTEYEVIRKVGKKVMDFKCIELQEDHEGAVNRHGEGGQKLSGRWDLSWHDLGITPDFLSKMQSY